MATLQHATRGQGIQTAETNSLMKKRKKPKPLPKFKHGGDTEDFQVVHNDPHHPDLEQVDFYLLTVYDQSLGVIQLNHGHGDFSHRSHGHDYHKVLYQSRSDCLTKQADKSHNGYPGPLKTPRHLAKTAGEFDVCIEKTNEKQYQVRGTTYSVKKDCRAKDDICHWHIVTSDTTAFDRVIAKITALGVDSDSGEVHVPVIDQSSTRPISTFFHNDELAAFLKRCMQLQPHPDDPGKFMDPHSNEDWLAYLQFIDDNDTYGLVTHGSFFPPGTTCLNELSSLGEE